jgi:AcrR family transcriptional regulator
MSGFERMTLAAYRIPSGPHGLPKEYVAANQRWRLIAATVGLAAEVGVMNLTVHAIARRAAVSPAVPSREFASIDELIAVSLEALGKDLEARLEAASDRSEEEVSPTSRQVEAIRRFFLDQPSAAVLMAWGTAAGVPSTIEVRNRLIDRLSSCLVGPGTPPGSGAEWPAISALRVEGALALLLASDLESFPARELAAVLAAAAAAS